MTMGSRAPDQALPILVHLRFRRFSISWAGPFLREHMFFLGSDDGEFCPTDLDGIPPVLVTDRLQSNEAVNGAAFIRHWMAVSTRESITIVTLPQSKGDSIYTAQLPFGAHTVIASSGGFFIAPLGREGLMFTRPQDGPTHRVTLSSSPEEELNVYRVISLGAVTGKEIVACASRAAGVGTMYFEDGEHGHALNARTFDGLDVVDLCPLGRGNSDLSVAAVGRDNTFILLRDVIHDKMPVTLRYPGVQGTAYRVLSARGFLFLLTSKGLYAISGLIEQFRSGNIQNTNALILSIPLDAVDANLVGDRWLLIVTSDGVLRLDVDLLARDISSQTEPTKFHDERAAVLNLAWKRRDMHLRPVLAGT